MPKVGFDVTALLAGDTGVARYTRDIAAALERRGIDLRPFAIGRGDHGDALPAGTRRLRVPLRLVHRSWSLIGRPSAQSLTPACDLVHAPDLVPPPSKGARVVTVHDLVALDHPDLHPARSVAVQRQQLAAARNPATVVIAVSQSTAAALRSRGVDAERVVTAPNGLTAMPAPDPSVVPPHPYLLAVGAITPRKGLPTLAAAFSRAAIPPSVRLVFAGPLGWEGERVVDAVRSAGTDDRMIWLGRVSDAQLAALYDRAIAVCVPSVAEGFGFPLLEAAAAGAPVVASDLPVFRELDGCVTLYAPVRDDEAWTLALERVVGDESLRREAAARGRLVASEYTWDRTATLTIGAYNRAREMV